MDLSEYRPKPMLVTKETVVVRPRYPVIDAHNHLGELFGHSWDQRPVAELLEVFDQAGIRLLVDLDGGWGEELLYRHLDHFKAAAPDRFCVFGGVDWAAWPEHGDRFGEYAAGRLRVQAERGAQGLKVWKPFGLKVCDQNGALVALDDARLDPLWETVGELDLPVTIHIADPAAFFQPLDAANERYEELSDHSDWHFPSPPYPPFRSLMEALDRLVGSHPHTTFIGAHVGNCAEDLGWVGGMLDRHPNYYIDISARMAELGRQPYSARRFFIRYAERILFGCDIAPNADWYRLYYRFLETDDEYFSYDLNETPGQGRWRVYGLYLPDDVLQKLYFQNAERVILRRKER